MGHARNGLRIFGPSSAPVLPKVLSLFSLVVMTSLPASVVIATSVNASSETEADKLANDQMLRLAKAWVKCNHTIHAATRPSTPGLYCSPTWDNLMCWPNYVPAGQLATQPCAEYITGFNPFEEAKRLCTLDGTWAKHPDTKFNKSWTDFHSCSKPRSLVAPVIEKHMPIILKISTVGYSISLASLLVATSIMVYFKKLHCQRNTIHVNLFLSFILRAVICLLRNCLLVEGLALASDIEYMADGSIHFIKDDPHWECKLLNTLWQYTLGASYMWIFVEGLYLHTLIFFAVFSQSRRFFKIYIILGWVFPVIFVIIWVLLRVFKNDVLCWNTHERGFYWVLNAPIVASISINFFFFLNIIRVLFTKIRDCNTRDPRRYRKLAKSTLVLIPLFGVYYIVFIVLSNYREPEVAVIHMYLEMTLNSFQGTVISLLFCFLNGEVRAEIMKKWHRHWLRRQSVVSGRSSRTFSTTTFCLRERASLSQGTPLYDPTCRDPSGASPPHSPNGKPSPPLDNSVPNAKGALHKVTSLPKMISAPGSPKAGLIPRVSSSPKVTFQCSDNNFVNPVPGDTFTQQASFASSNPASLTDKAISAIDENTFLLKDSVRNSSSFNEEDSNSPDLHKRRAHGSASNHKGLSLVKDPRPVRHRASPEEGRLPPKQDSNINGLPPIADVEEDSAETTPIINGVR